MATDTDTTTTTTPTMPPKRRFSSRHGAPLLALVGMIALTLGYARLTLTGFATGIVGGYYNGYENVWNDWWLREALKLHKNPFYSTYIEYPKGVSLRFHTLNPFGGLIALPLTPLLGPIATMNLKLLAAIAAGAFFAYLLARDQTGNDLASFAGGAVYIFANWLLISYYVSAEENYLMGTALLPLFLFFALRAVNRPRGWPYAFWATATLFALCLTDWQYTMFAVILTVLYALVTLTTQAGRRDAARVWTRFAAIGGVWAIIVFVPLVLPMIREAQSAPWLAVDDEATANSVPLLQFLRPGFWNPGYLVLLVGIVGLVLLWRQGPGERRRVAAYWITAAVVGCVLSLGPLLKILPGEATTGIPLPYMLWYHLPVLNIGRKPQLYYASIGSLAFGMLAAIALAALLPALRDAIIRRTRRIGRLPLARLVPGVIVCALLIVTLAPFFAATTDNAVQPPYWPKFYRDVLAHDPAQYAILEAPVYPGKHALYNGTYAAYQIIHGKYRFGASISRDHNYENPDLLVTHETLLRDFFLLGDPHATDPFRPPKGPDFLATPDYGQIGVPLLNYYHVHYIVLYLDALTDNRAGMLADTEALVHQVLGANATPIYTDARMEVYQVPDAPPLAQPIVLDTGEDGWYTAQVTPDKTPYRWADTTDGKPATLLATNLSPQRRTARVQLSVYNYLAPRDIKVELNGVAITGFSLAPSETHNLTLTLDLPPGLNTISLSTPQPSIPVQTDGKTRDDRLLSFGVREITLA